MYSQQTRAHPARDPSGFSSACSPRPGGDPGKAERGSPCRRSFGSALRSWSWVPLWSGGGRPDKAACPARGAGQDGPPLATGQEPCRQTPADRSEPAACGRRV